jgi:hypothetical protein
MGCSPHGRKDTLTVKCKWPTKSFRPATNQRVYTFHVRSVGGNAGYSDWSNPVSRMGVGFLRIKQPCQYVGMTEFPSVEAHGAQDIEIIRPKLLFFSPTVLLFIKFIKQLFELRNCLWLIACRICQRFKFTK